MSRKNHNIKFNKKIIDDEFSYDYIFLVPYYN